ncbi:MAG: GTP 3',8-cyclase MoaA [Amphritea sp.]
MGSTSNLIQLSELQHGIDDRFNRKLTDLRLSVMDRCNYRCPYCMPADKYDSGFPFLKSEQRLSIDEMVRLAKIFVSLGVSKLRLTGGEPLLRADLPELIQQLSRIDGVKDLALTTNGSLLARQAQRLKAAGLTRVTVSLDSLDPKVFRHMTGGRGDLNEVLEGIRVAQEVGLQPIKINTVVQKGVNDGTVMQLLDYFRGTGVIVRLIEYMDVGTCNNWSGNQTVPSREWLPRIGKIWPIRPLQSNQSEEVASRYQYLDGAGEFGLISSVSEPFCGDCSRARISSDGQLYTCLFASQGRELKSQLRNGSCDDDIHSVIRSTWQQRQDRYSEERGRHTVPEASGERIEMFYIGG